MPEAKQWSSHTQRLVTAIAMGIPLAAVLAAGPYWSWLLLVGAAAAVGLWEIQGLLFAPALPQRWLAFFIAAGLLMPLGAALGGAAGLHAGMALCLLAGFSAMLAAAPLDPAALDRLSRFALSWLYIPYALSYVLLIGQLERGREWVFFCLAVTVANDAGAYYTGRRLGRRKLYERVSPKKTIEGSLGGAVASIAMGVLLGVVLIGNLGVAKYALLSAILAIVGQVGDLIESMIKRISGKKDSSHLIPGHGGLLDRLDSLLFVFPTTWLFLSWMH